MGIVNPRPNSTPSPWRLTGLNQWYELCQTYPSLIVVPAGMSNGQVEAVARFRSEQRMPVLCWGKRTDSTSIWRSSQPKIGMSRASCTEDEQMLAHLAAASPTRILPIVDCRPRTSATANFATG
ncbi:unnamed protein product, partial [Choristocarpus tenellus]